MLAPLALWCVLASPVSGESVFAEDKVEELFGTVVDSNGKPVPTLEVQGYRKGKKVQQALRTDAKGKFAMPRSWRDEADLYYALVARTKDEVGWMIPGMKNKRDGWNAGFQIKLVPFDQTIVGRFIDIHGNPLENAEVEVSGLGFDDDNAWLLRGWFRSDPILSAIRTKKDGEFRIPVPRGTRGQFLPRHPEWVSIRNNWNSEQTIFELIRLPPAGQIEGTVTDSRTGKPIAGVEIGAQCLHPSGLSGGWGEAITDKQGKFTIGGLEPDRYNVLMMEHFSDPTLTAAAVAGVTVKADSSTRADLRVIKGRLLTGRVIDGQTGKAVTKCPVGYYGGARPRPGAAGMMENTDVDGKFHFYVPAGAS